MTWPIAHLRPSGIFGASVLILASLFSSQLALGQSTQIIPPDRIFAWNPGMMSKGGIPSRTTICATLSPSGRDDSAAIQAALDHCPSSQVVLLKPGKFIVNNYLLIRSPITLRGSGAGVTILTKANGARARLSTIVTGTNLPTPQDPTKYAHDSRPVVIVGPSRWPGPDNSTSRSLTADGQRGAYSVALANASGFAAGQFVLLDETSGASWQPVPPGMNCADSDTGTLTGSISGSKMTVTSAPRLQDGANVVNIGDTLTGSGVAANTQIMSQLSGTPAEAGTYTVSPGGQSVASTTITAKGPCPPLVWEGDRVSFSNMNFPKQRWAGPNANLTDGPYDTTPGVLPASMSWFSRTNRMTSEIKEIASVAGNTVTFTSPLAISYRTSHFAQLTRYIVTDRNSVHVANAGVENLSMVGGSDGSLRFEDAAYSWAKNVEVTQWLGEGIAIDGSFRIEVRDSYIHTGSWPEPGGAGYAISLAHSSSEVLMENNIFIDVNKNMVFRASGAGTVVAYNYADDSYDFDTPTWVEVGLNASHMAGPHHVLFEGNYSHNFDSDVTWGNAIDLTIFRNVLTGQRRDLTDQGNRRAAGLNYGSWNDSFVGNILGRSGQMSGWRYTDPMMGCDASGNNCTGQAGTWQSIDIWELGITLGRYTIQPDPKVLSTVIRDGNYDFLTNSQHWHNTPGGFAIPNSMYLASKPAFFGSNPWPWSDPATGTLYTLPAKARYDAGAANQVNYMIAVSASPRAGKVSGGGTFTAGSSRTVTATANSGYTFANWTENGVVVSAAASYTFTLTANRTLVANFTVKRKKP